MLAGHLPCVCQGEWRYPFWWILDVAWYCKRPQELSSLCPKPSFLFRWNKSDAMLCSCQNLAGGFSPVKNLFQTKLVHKNASSCSLAERKKDTWSAWWVVHVDDVCLLFSLHNLQPKALSLRALRCWLLARIIRPSCLIYHKFSKALSLQLRHTWSVPSPWMLQQGSTGILENTAHLENHTWTRAKCCVLEPDWSPYFRKGSSRRRWDRHEEKRGGEGERAGGKRLQKSLFWSTHHRHCYYHHHCTLPEPVLGARKVLRAL